MFDFYVISSDYSPFVRSLDLKAVPQSSFFSGFSSLPEVALKGYVQEACQKGQTFGYRPRDFTPKAFFFDMDHTSICEESLAQLAYASGVGEAIEKLTQEGLRGEINFANNY